MLIVMGHFYSYYVEQTSTLEVEKSVLSAQHHSAVFFHQRIAKMMKSFLMLKNFEAPKIVRPRGCGCGKIGTELPVALSIA